MQGRVALVGLLSLLAGCSSAVSDDPARAGTHFAALILPEPYTSIKFVFQAVPEFVPSAFAQDALRSIAREATGKESTIGPTTYLPAQYSGPRDWSEAELRELARAMRLPEVNEFGNGTTAIVPVYYLRGVYDGENLGVMIDGDLFVFDVNGAAERRAPFVGERSERATLIHEFGHALGLVNCGIPMTKVREIPTSRCHSQHHESVMGINDTISAQALANDTWIPWQFDADDLADIAAYRSAHS